MFWSDELTSALRRLWEQGLTGGEIARTLGLNRNSILGKAHRMGLLGYRKPRTRAVEVGIAPFRKAARRPPTFRDIPIALPLGAAGRSFNCLSGPSYDLMDLKRRDCHWPIGDPLQPGFCYCAAPVKSGSYCPAHTAIAYEKPYRIR